MKSLDQDRSWLASPVHRAWLRDQATLLLRFFRAVAGPDGWFSDLDDDGQAVASPEQRLLCVARAVHCFALGERLGLPGCRAVVDAGLTAMWEQHRDPGHGGGYLAGVGRDGPIDTTKAAYDHAFVLLAGASATQAGHPEAGELFDDTLSVIDEHFWSDVEGASREAFDRDWRELESYRGANSNMHLCESLLAAADAADRPDLAARAERLASKLIDGYARANDWLLPEHYDPSWQPLWDYNHDRLDDRFRPFGATIGHSLEWSRLVVSAGLATGRLDDWCLDAAEALFERAVTVGWDQDHGGLAYTVGWDGKPANPDHYWWPVAEGIAAASYLFRLTGRAVYEGWYRRFWEYAANVLMDHERAGWYPIFDPENRPKTQPWRGKPDVYHILQACLLPALPVASSVMGAATRSETEGLE